MQKQPLLVYLLFHPESTGARDLARHIHQQLNDECVVPGLRIPTLFCPVSDGFRPQIPQCHDLAERNLIVPLADDRLTIDDDWCSYMGDAWANCRPPDSRCVPFQLTANAWPLDPRLKVVSFARAYLQPEGDLRNAFVIRRLVVELCRYLRDLDSRGDQSEAPVKLFLSHAKADLNVEPKVAQQFIKILSEDQPIEAWVDSGDIPAGSQFGKAIGNGVENTSLLVILTENYASREWCREEVLLAKEHQRPIAVVDALSKYEVRSFPYLGNVPRVRWNGDPQTGIDLLLKETLRNLHTMPALRRFQQPGDIIFSRPPELATLVGLEPESHVLYPDPPLGVGEARRLARTRVHVATPLQRLATDQSLHGEVVALSMSESTDIARFGLDPLHLEAGMLELSRYLLIKGATLAFGGHLGPNGYTQRLFELVRTHNSLESVEPFGRIVNHRGWPLPRLTVEKLAELNEVAREKELPRPADVDEALHPDFKVNPEFFSGEKSPQHRFAWARGMTEMRRFQSDSARSGVVARVVLGGTFGRTTKVAEDGTRSERWYLGRIPGVLEEVLLSVQAGQPVFLMGAYGGVARLVIDLIQGRPRPEATWDYQKQAPFAVETRELYRQRGVEWIDYPEIASILKNAGVEGINPYLTEEEHEDLFDTVDPLQMVEIVMRGLNRLQAKT